MQVDQRYNLFLLVDAAIKVLIDNGVNETDAKIVVDSMIEADYSGVNTHGIRMLSSYVEKLKNKEFSLLEPEVKRSCNSFTVIDANNSMGPVSANKATLIAIEKAKENGIYFVFSRNSNTYGPAFYYAEKIAKAGLLGFTCCNTPATMPLVNGIEPMLGTNPLAFACPSVANGSIILDMATSVIAKSKIGLAKTRGEKLNEGCALDSDGNPTVDPAEAIRGMILPMAGYKGSGLALMIDIISGFLSGSEYLNKVGKFYSSNGESMNVGQLFVAIDPVLIYGDEFYNDFEDYIDVIRRSKSHDGINVTIPGDGKVAKRKENEEKGLFLPEETVEKLRTVIDIDYLKI